MTSSIDRSEGPFPVCQKWERCVIAGCFGLMLIMRVIYAFHFRFDADEPQHLHIVWGWANGLMQYREVFDNHGPIFHLLCVPLFRALGERADILILMRLAMIPLLGIALWCVYRIGANIFSKRVGLWAAVFTGLYPEFFFTSTEFRTDNLWTVLWLIALVIATSAGLNVKRSFLIGLLLGTAFGVTVKTGLMVGAVSFAAIWIVGRQWMADRTVNWRQIFAFASAGVLGLLIVPAALVLFFAAHGALREFLYCNIFHNLVPHAQNWEHFDAHVLWFPIFALIAVAAFVRLEKRRIEPRTLRVIFLILVAGSYFTALKTFFPTLSRQDDLPFIPLLVLLITALISGELISRPEQESVSESLDGLEPATDEVVFAGSVALSMPSVIPDLLARIPSAAVLRKSFPPFAPLIAFAEILSILVTVHFWKDNTREDIAMVAEVLKTTKPSDYVMDATGETIYRRRPFYFVIEAFTRVRIQQGSIKDEIVEKMIDTRTPLARPEGLPKKSREFIRQNYLPVGNGLFILGKMLGTTSVQSNGASLAFDVIIPARYYIVSKSGLLTTGTLDGEPLGGPRSLEPGKHVLQLDSKMNENVALYSADGWERHSLLSERRKGDGEGRGFSDSVNAGLRELDRDAQRTKEPETLKGKSYPSHEKSDARKPIGNSKP